LKSRLKRPLLTVVVGGALFAGGVAAVPAFAAPLPDPVKGAADQPLPPGNLPPAFQAKADPAPSSSASAPANPGNPAPNPSGSSSANPGPNPSGSSNPGGPGRTRACRRATSR
jgi:hypothetical protein